MADVKRMATNFGHKTGQYFSKFKETSRIKVLELQIASRQRRFGAEFLALRERGSPTVELEDCVRRTKKDVAILRGRIEEHEEAYATKKAEVRSRIASGTGVEASAPGTRDSPWQSGHSSDVLWKTKPRKPYKPAPVVIEQDGIHPCFENTDPSKWSVTKINFKGAAKYDQRGHREAVEGVMIQDGINRFQANPGKYVAMWYHKVQLEEMRPGHACRFTYLHREGTVNYRPIGVPDGHLQVLLNVEKPCHGTTTQSMHRDAIEFSMSEGKGNSSRRLHDDKSLQRQR